MTDISELETKVRKALTSYKVKEKRMFGGLVFMINGKMCMTVNERPDHVMMVRIDQLDQEQALQRKGAQVAVMRGRKMNGWIYLQWAAIREEEDFDYWIKLSLKYNALLSL